MERIRLESCVEKFCVVPISASSASYFKTHKFLSLVDNVTRISGQRPGTNSGRAPTLVPIRQRLFCAPPFPLGSELRLVCQPLPIKPPNVTRMNCEVRLDPLVRRQLDQSIRSLTMSNSFCLSRSEGRPRQEAVLIRSRTLLTSRSSGSPFSILAIASRI